MRRARPLPLLLVALLGMGEADPQGFSRNEPGAKPPLLQALQDASLSAELREEIREALQRQDYTRAETLLVAEIEKQESAPLLRLAGAIFFLDGKYLNSAIALKKAEAIEPLDESSRFTLAMSYVVLRRPDWARPELESLGQAHPENPLYPYWLARLDYEAGEYAKAVERLLQVIQLEPSFLRAYDNLGLASEALGKFEQAQEYYQRALDLNRKLTHPSPWPPLNLGILLTQLGDYQRAETLLRESLRYDPSFPQAHYRLGVVLEKQGHYPEAIEALQEAAALDPSYPDPYYALGRVYRRVGKLEEAKTALQEFQRRKKEQAPPSEQSGKTGNPGMG